MDPKNKVVLKAIEAARKNVKTYPELAPVFFIGAGDDLKIINVPFERDSDKHMAQALIKKFALEMKADFILFIAESWALNCTMEEYEKDKDKYTNIAGHPKAIEIVAFMLETKTRSWLGSAKILKDRELGEVEWSDGGAAGGRFSNMLGEKPTVH